MKNEGTGGRTKGTEFTRPLSSWESKMKKKKKKSSQNLSLCLGQTHGQTKLNS